MPYVVARRAGCGTGAKLPPELPRRGPGDDRPARETACCPLLTFEEFLAREAQEGRLQLPLKKIAERALVHGHCHQKAFDVLSPVETC